MKKKILMSLASLSAVFILSACTGNQDEAEPKSTDHAEESMEGMDHSNMDHSSSGEVPNGLKIAGNPTYPVGSKAVIQSDHMSGMMGAEATISGAFDTVVYTVSYTPTSGGEEVTDHKWVIHEELKNAGEAPLTPGTEVVLNANHMGGMQGATATIDSATETTVYMVDFTSSTGEEIKNHMWVTEDELSK